MNDEILKKFKKALSIAFLVVVGIILFLVVVLLFLTAVPQTQQASVTDSFGESESSLSGFAPWKGVSGGAYNDLPEPTLTEGEYSSLDYERGNEPPASSKVPISSSERKLIQNGALSLSVDRVEDSITLLYGIAENLGGRIDSVSMYNIGAAAKKRATVAIRVPAVNFGAAMEQAKKIARKVQSQNVSTQDITEQFIDMQARLKNLKAEETQYLDIMQKASKIEDVLRVSEKLYSVRQQIEQLQGQMNYLSRQVDMSLITVELSSEPDIEPTNVVWSPGTVAKEAIQALLVGISNFFSIVIVFALFLIPIIILWGAVAVLAVWVIWKALIWVKKRINQL